MTGTMTLAQARTLLAEVVTGHEDRVAKCAYTNVDDTRRSSIEPVCVVGQVLALWGVPLGLLDRLEGFFEPYPDADLVCGPVEVLSDEGFNLTPTAQRYLRRAQVTQDHGAQWELALRDAEYLAENITEES